MRIRLLNYEKLLIEQLNETDIANSQEKTFRRLIFIGIIATLETYLSDAFINTINKSEKNKRKFVETFKDFQQQKFSLNKVYDIYNQIDEECKKALSEILYHNLGKVKNMYKDTLNIDLGDIAIISKYVSQRHDLVHRNGKTTDNEETIIDKQTIIDLLHVTNNFVKNIDEQIKALDNEEL
jgi:hypothetical protein